MQQPTPRPEPMYSGAMTDENIRSIFQGAGDFIARELMCSGLRLYAYVTTSSFASLFEELLLPLLLPQPASMPPAITAESARAKNCFFFIVASS